MGLSYGDFGEGMDGFFCSDSSGAPLIDRALGASAVSLTADFVSMGGGTPGARGIQIVSWCRTHDCRIAPGGRFCFDLGPSTVAIIAANEAPNPKRGHLLDAFKLGAGTPITRDAPDGTVLLRLVFSLEPCSAVNTLSAGDYPTFDPAQLLGCVYSSPVNVNAFDGDLFVGFDTAGGVCAEQAVKTCSDPHFKYVP